MRPHRAGAGQRSAGRGGAEVEALGFGLDDHVAHQLHSRRGLEQGQLGGVVLRYRAGQGPSQKRCGAVYARRVVGSADFDRERSAETSEATGLETMRLSGEQGLCGECPGGCQGGTVRPADHCVGWIDTGVVVDVDGQVGGRRGGEVHHPRRLPPPPGCRRLPIRG